MKKRYAIGDRVKIIPGTDYAGQSKGGEGVIDSFNHTVPDIDSDIIDSKYYYQVRWDEGGSNSYRPIDLMPADSKPIDKHEKLAQTKESIVAEIKERFGFISKSDMFETPKGGDGLVKTIYPDEWYYYAGTHEVVLYLAKQGEGGCRIYNYDVIKKEVTWARRTRLPDKWQIAFDPNTSNGDSINDWRKATTRLSKAVSSGYLREDGYHTYDVDYTRAIITYDEFVKWVQKPTEKTSDLWVDPGSKKVWKIVANCDIDPDKEVFVKGKMPFIPKGTVLWTSDTNNLRNIIDKSNSVHPFSNKWGANIPAKFFDIHPDNPYPDDKPKTVEEKPKVSACGKFKVGDVVTGWHSTGSSMARLESWVIAGFSDSGKYAIPEGHLSYNTSVGSIKHFKPERKFNVGDTVRVVNQTHGWGDVKTGDIGKIKDCPGKQDGNYKYYVDFPNQRGWTGLEHCFEPVESDTVSVEGKHIMGVDPYDERKKEHQ